MFLFLLLVIQCCYPFPVLTSDFDQNDENLVLYDEFNANYSCSGLRLGNNVKRYSFCENSQSQPNNNNNDDDDDDEMFISSDKGQGNNVRKSYQNVFNNKVINLLRDTLKEIFQENNSKIDFENESLRLYEEILKINKEYLTSLAMFDYNSRMPDYSGRMPDYSDNRVANSNTIVVDSFLWQWLEKKSITFEIIGSQVHFTKESLSLIREKMSKSANRVLSIIGRENNHSVSLASSEHQFRSQPLLDNQKTKCQNYLLEQQRLNKQRLQHEQEQNERKKKLEAAKKNRDEKEILKKQIEEQEILAKKFREEEIAKKNSLNSQKGSDLQQEKRKSLEDLRLLESELKNKYENLEESRLILKDELLKYIYKIQEHRELLNKTPAKNLKKQLSTTSAFITAVTNKKNSIEAEIDKLEESKKEQKNLLLSQLDNEKKDLSVILEFISDKRYLEEEKGFIESLDNDLAKEHKRLSSNSDGGVFAQILETQIFLENLIISKNKIKKKISKIEDPQNLMLKLQLIARSNRKQAPEVGSKKLFCTCLENNNVVLGPPTKCFYCDNDMENQINEKPLNPDSALFIPTYLR